MSKENDVVLETARAYDGSVEKYEHATKFDALYNSLNEFVNLVA